MTTPTVDAAEQRRLVEEEAARVSRVFFQTEARTGSPAGAPGGTTMQSLDLAGLTGQPGQQTAQDRQLAFLDEPVGLRTTASDRVMPPASPYLLQAGGRRPGRVIPGIRSDLPGQITAQATENICDSPTGRIPLVASSAPV